MPLNACAAQKTGGSFPAGLILRLSPFFPSEYGKTDKEKHRCNKSHDTGEVHRPDGAYSRIQRDAAEGSDKVGYLHYKVVYADIQ